MKPCTRWLCAPSLVVLLAHCAADGGDPVALAAAHQTSTAADTFDTSACGGVACDDVRLDGDEHGRLVLRATGHVFRLLGAAVCPDGGCNDYETQVGAALRDSSPGHVALAGGPLPDAAAPHSLTDALYWEGRLLRAMGYNAVRYVVPPGVSTPVQCPDGHSIAMTHPMGGATLALYIQNTLLPHLHALEAAGLYIVVDFHGEPPTPTCDTVASGGHNHDPQYYDWFGMEGTWTALASALADDPYIAAYQVWNEYGDFCTHPSSGTHDMLASVAANNAAWIRAIRAQDPRRLVLVSDCNAGWNAVAWPDGSSGRATSALQASWGTSGQLAAGLGPLVFSRHSGGEGDDDDLDASSATIGHVIWNDEQEGPVGTYGVDMRPGTGSRAQLFANLNDNIMVDATRASQPSAFAFLLRDDFAPEVRGRVANWAREFVHSVGATPLTFPAGHDWNSWPPARDGGARFDPADAGGLRMTPTGTQYQWTQASLIRAEYVDNLVEAGNDGDGTPLTVCRVWRAEDHSVHPGKYRASGTCNYGYHGHEVAESNPENFDLLGYQGPAPQWGTPGGHDEGLAFAGGYESYGIPLVVCRATVGATVQPGKVVGEECHVGYGNQELVSPTYQILLR